MQVSPPTKCSSTCIANQLIWMPMKTNSMLIWSAKQGLYPPLCKSLARTFKSIKTSKRLWQHPHSRTAPIFQLCREVFCSRMEASSQLVMISNKCWPVLTSIKSRASNLNRTLHRLRLHILLNGRIKTLGGLKSRNSSQESHCQS